MRGTSYISAISLRLQTYKPLLVLCISTLHVKPRPIHLSPTHLGQPGVEGVGGPNPLEKVDEDSLVLDPVLSRSLRPAGRWSGSAARVSFAWLPRLSQGAGGGERVKPS